MVFVGLFLLLVAVVLVLGGVFGADGYGVEFLGFDANATVVFFLGLVAGLAALWGLQLTKWGAKREWRERRDQKKLEELSSKLNAAEQRREKDLDDPDLR